MTSYQVTDPATGEVLNRFPSSTDREVDEALRVADSAYRTWSQRSSVRDRAALADQFATLMDSRKVELANIINREMGKPISQGIGEVDFSVKICRAFARHAEEWLADEPLNVDDGLTSFFRFQGLGVILGIMPWNYPYYQVARFAIPNLILGNTVILKHASQCPESASVLAELFQSAGFPEGAYVNVFATHDQLSTIVADDRVQGVSLTGSERAGSLIAEQAGKHLKKCVLELGGSDVFLVLETSDLDAAVKYALAGRMDNTGQSCNGSKRIVVMDQYFAEFSEKFRDAMENLSLENGDFGPLSSSGATQELVGQVQRALDQGAELLVGNNAPNGNVYTPGILVGVTPEMEVYSEELFGPVAQLYRVSSDEEAIELANSSPYGLGCVIICDDRDRAERVGNQLDVGMVFVGASGLGGPDVPFGGVKKSGFGRELGRVGMLEFANKKLFRFAN